MKIYLTYRCPICKSQLILSHDNERIYITCKKCRVSYITSINIFGEFCTNNFLNWIKFIEYLYEMFKICVCKIWTRRVYMKILN